MRLADFIMSNMEPILAEWVTFARTSAPAAESMDSVALRDHAREMLQVMAADLCTPQSEREREAKSKGNAAVDTSAPDTAAEVHGAGRAESGFTVGEMVSEYRALRASVIRLWTKDSGKLEGGDLDDLMRFNEAIDQSIAESITRYTHDLDRSREMFVAVLGHDLRSPLGAVTMASQFMLDTGDLAEPHLTLTTRIVRTTHRMTRMVGDLLDFTRSRLGAGVPITRAPMNLEQETRNAIDEVTAANPECEIDLNASGELEGSWDSARLGQVLTNLLGNAVQHGTDRSRISVTLRGESDDVRLLVHNRSPVIPPSELPGIFGPFKRLRAETEAPAATSSLGLGLYIAERIVTAHGGTIGVTSTDADGTSFSVCLPR